MKNTINLLVNKNNDGDRADVFLSKKITRFTRTYIKKLIKGRNCKINKKLITSPSARLKINDNVTIKLIYKEEQKLVPKKLI